ncbi:MAG: hypothetical protein MHMPM18_001597 [Marteilia pararefringens]
MPAITEDFTKSKGYIYPSFGAYGGFQGLYDYGPLGAPLKNEIIKYWRRIFISEDNNHEIDSTILTPEVVLNSSGHTSKFTDYSIQDVETGEKFRVDHLIKDFLSAQKDKFEVALNRLEGLHEISSNDKAIQNFLNFEGLSSQLDKSDGKSIISASGVSKPTTEYLAEYKNHLNQKVTQINSDLSTLDNLDKQGLKNIIEEYQIKSPITNNDLNNIEEFNLMFKTHSASKQKVLFMRPETSQGIFTNFLKLFAFNQSKLPFGAAIIGKAFRNEISPRNGLIRTREFDMAEMQFFYDPFDDHHSKFSEISHVNVRLFTKDEQLNCTQQETPEQKRNNKSHTLISVKDAYETGIIKSEIIAYFIAKTQIFFANIGIDMYRVRFRQHLPNEKAHYASDCWDGEIVIDNDWIECCGIADRGSFDLRCHEVPTKLSFEVNVLCEPFEKSSIDIHLNKGELIKSHKESLKQIIDTVASLDDSKKQKMLEEFVSTQAVSLELAGKIVNLEKNCINVVQSKSIQSQRKVMPKVIEPSYGIGRIITALLEHTCYARPSDPKRIVFNFPSVIAPVKVSIFKLKKTKELVEISTEISKLLSSQGIKHNIDNSAASLGKRYVRSDIQGIPFAITVDFDSIDHKSVTIRDRDTMKQIRVKVSKF